MTFETFQSIFMYSLLFATVIHSGGKLYKFTWDNLAAHLVLKTKQCFMTKGDPQSRRRETLSIVTSRGTTTGQLELYCVATRAKLYKMQTSTVIFAIWELGFYIDLRVVKLGFNSINFWLKWSVCLTTFSSNYHSTFTLL